MADTNPRDLIQQLANALEALQKEAVTTPHNQTIVVGGVAHPIPIGNDLLARDALHAYLLDRARAYLAQPEPEGPTAWMYLGEPDYDGRDWHDHWEVTLDEKLARYASGNNDPVPLWRTPAINPAPQDS